MSVKELRDVVDFVGPKLGAEEFIVQIRQGQTRYGRRTVLYFVVNIATLPQMTGNEPESMRSIVVSVDSGGGSVSESSRDNWKPYVDSSLYKG